MGKRTKQKPLAGKYKVYRITNDLNDKVYIGVTREVDKRFRQHCAGIKTCNMGAAIAALGAEHFRYEVIDSTDSLFEAFYVLEPYHIGRHRSDETGYNGNIRLARPLYYGRLQAAFNQVVHGRRPPKKSKRQKPEREETIPDEWARIPWEKLDLW